MAKANPKAKLPSTSKQDSDSGANLSFDGDSTNAYNWRSKFMANVHSSRSKRSRQKPKAPGNRTDTSAGQRSSDSEN